MSDRENGDGRYWQVGLTCTVCTGRAEWAGLGLWSAPWYIRSSMIHDGTCVLTEVWMDSTVCMHGVGTAR